MIDFEIIVLVVFACSIIHSVFGTGILIFGTPTCLLLGYPFDVTISYLLPASISISSLQIFHGRKNIKLKGEFFIFTIPFIIFVQGISNINNVFSPNNDGINDKFSFGEFGMKNIEVVIYNRWGQEVYSWNGENIAWDGRGADGENLPEAVYFFALKADGIDGRYYEEKGSITIVR